MRALALVLSLLALSSTAGGATAQVAGVSGWYGFSGPIFVVMRNGETTRVRDGIATPLPNALTSRPASEWVAGFSAISDGAWADRFWAITNTGELVEGSPTGWNGSRLNLFTAAGRPPGEIVTMQGGTNSLAVLTSAGDVFEILVSNGFQVGFSGNIGGPATTTTPSTIGRLKDQYLR